MQHPSPPSSNISFAIIESSRKWWNWQTHHLEGVAPKGVGVQIPPSAPIDRPPCADPPSNRDPIHHSVYLRTGETRVHFQSQTSLSAYIHHAQHSDRSPPLHRLVVDSI